MEICNDCNQPPHECMCHSNMSIGERERLESHLDHTSGVEFRGVSSIQEILQSDTLTRHSVIALYMSGGGVTATFISKAIGCHRNTAYARLEKLKDKGYVRCDEVHHRNNVRKKIFWLADRVAAAIVAQGFGGLL